MRRYSAGQVAVISFLLAMPFQAVHAQRKFERINDPDFDLAVARPAFTDRHPRVLLDEAHFNYHTSDGFYKPLVDLITNDGCRVTPNKKKFSAEALDGFDILLIANAGSVKPPRGPNVTDPAFTKEECDAVYAWVQAGGSLLLIADHAPAGAMAEILANRFGVDMGKGWAVDSEHNTKSGNKSWLVYTEKNRLLGDHAIIHGRNADERVKHVVTFTGQSLKGPIGSVALLKLSDTAEERRRPGAKKTVSAKGRAQAVAFQCGKGRVVVLGEAAMLTAGILTIDGKKRSKIGMNFPGSGNRQFSLNMMRWLSGSAE
ncbi:MAG: hypothetical protein P8M30_11325 [Planctomycetaceae bacterium]|nr:hypothetical protein [Planctomycetaceae bacterium]